MRVLNTCDIDFLIDELKSKRIIVAVKTDTVYGLICNALNSYVTDKIYKLKKRDKNKPLGIFLNYKMNEANLYDNLYEALLNYIDTTNINNDTIYRLIKKYWPGALTIIFKKKKNILLNISTDTIGIRVPNDKTLLKILSMIDFPIAQTSLNISGEAVLTDKEDIINNFGNYIDYIFDTGNNKFSNTNSTVIEVLNNNIKVVREGQIRIDDFN